MNNIKILVATNSKSERFALVKILEKENYQVFEAIDGNEAIQKFEELKPHLVLMDLHLTDLDFEHFAQIREKTLSSNDLILMSDQNEIEAAITKLKGNVYNFLRIPCKRIDLILKINNALEHQKLTQQVKDLSSEIEKLRSNSVVTKKEESEAEKFKLIYDAFIQSVDPIVITDVKGAVLQINRAFTKTFGYKPEEIAGKTTNLIRSSHPQDEIFKEMWDSINSKGEWRGEIINCAKDGTEIPIWLIITSILKNEKKIGYMGIEIDLRHRKKLEERLLYLERLAAIGQMSAQMSHEIRNPLSSMSLNTELLLEEMDAFPDSETEEARSLIHSISSEIDRLSIVNDEYLSFARLPKFDPKPTQLNTILEQLYELFHFEAEQKSIKMSMNLEKTLPVVTADENQMKQALLNIIKNGIEAMPQGGVISLSSWLNEKEEVEIRIEDTGTGMTEETLNKFFDPFFSTKDKGTGLGMVVTLQIIEEHQGEIECNSNLGVGTTFTIRIPVVSKNKTSVVY